MRLPFALLLVPKTIGTPYSTYRCENLFSANATNISNKSVIRFDAVCYRKPSIVAGIEDLSGLLT
jgi:hypothetical protein